MQVILYTDKGALWQPFCFSPKRLQSDSECQFCSVFLQGRKGVKDDNSLGNSLQNNTQRTKRATDQKTKHTSPKHHAKHTYAKTTNAKKSKYAERQENKRRTQKEKARKIAEQPNKKKTHVKGTTAPSLLDSKNATQEKHRNRLEKPSWVQKVGDSFRVHPSASGPDLRSWYTSDSDNNPFMAGNHYLFVPTRMCLNFFLGMGDSCLKQVFVFLWTLACCMFHHSH